MNSNSQIADTVSQANLSVVGEAPSMAAGTLYQTLVHSTGVMFENAVTGQNNQNILSLASTTQGVMQIYSVDTISDAVSIARMLQASA
ncbi:antirepresssor protein RebB [Agrobacterium vitis]|uniref:RebB family R body protein n=1 Tax=Agrobacterium vitis TaxID=373 RepID=UPI0008722D33|nr:RebB family R body protein [Agrobacterium vitis]MCE6076502.1 antirepresssor protein RebB [Agrobacterium vitis]MCF1452178.1 antirepresssor protein RebB [Agrobacterium vitis]MCM2451654.1 antirepresssor protein RebB [Agrobacterium vitis]MCM2471204.1 antirepresssor protein RebB [Agrobacterium vitis]MUO70196.1 antirepresssor protein RebB [Agrobacterium vitis]